MDEHIGSKTRNMASTSERKLGSLSQKKKKRIVTGTAPGAATSADEVPVTKPGKMLKKGTPLLTGKPSPQSSLGSSPLEMTGKRKTPDSGVQDGKRSGSDNIAGKKKKKVKNTNDGAASGGGRPGVKPGQALHPFDHDPADDCETCFQAYQDICPFLQKLAQRLGKTKQQVTSVMHAAGALV